MASSTDFGRSKINSCDAASHSPMHARFVEIKDKINISNEQRKIANDQLTLIIQECEKNPTEENLKLFLETKNECESWDNYLHIYNLLFITTQQKIRFE